MSKSWQVSAETTISIMQSFLLLRQTSLISLDLPSSLAELQHEQFLTEIF